ncbi:MAG: DNA replication/repair protein RecF [Actinomycetota bacterium]
MQVNDLVLETFRNYERQEIEFAEGLNLVVGRNAQGKTNLLEGVYCLSGLGSPRGPDGTLIKEGSDGAFLHARVTRGDRPIEIDMELRPKRALRLLINKNAVQRSKALGRLPVTVFFGPDELSLVKGSPDGRRRFLDDLVVKLRPSQDSLRREWEKVLKQRNALLRSLPKPDPPASMVGSLEVWNEAFFVAGAAVAAARLKALARLIPFADRRYKEVAGAGLLKLSYVSSWIPEDVSTAALAAPDEIDEAVLSAALRARVNQLRTAELERRVSLTGPGRDDVLVLLRSGEGPLLDARTFASQGDQRTAALALKLGEHDLLTEALLESPILLLDDVFSELDPRRREWLRDAVRGVGQTILSSAEVDSWASVHAERTFHVSAGRATTAGS